jgi:hypothetical protein
MMMPPVCPVAVTVTVTFLVTGGVMEIGVFTVGFVVATGGGLTGDVGVLTVDGIKSDVGTLGPTGPGPRVPVGVTVMRGGGPTALDEGVPTAGVAGVATGLGVPLGGGLFCSPPSVLGWFGWPSGWGFGGFVCGGGFEVGAGGAVSCGAVGVGSTGW